MTNDDIFTAFLTSLDIFSIDFQTEEFFYIMDSAWIESWLHYIHLNKDSPRPGPCKNNRLIIWDEESSKWVGRKGLYMADNSRSGDYRRVSEATWKEYCRRYEGSGPSIRISIRRDAEQQSSGVSDISEWVIEVRRI